MGTAVVKSAQRTALAGDQKRHVQELKGLGMTLGNRGGAGEGMPETSAVKLPFTLFNGGGGVEGRVQK